MDFHQTRPEFGAESSSLLLALPPFLHSEIVGIKSKISKLKSDIYFNISVHCCSIKLVAIGSACLAFIFGIVQMGLTSAFIDAWSWVPTIIIQNIQNSFFSVNAVRALIAIILICSVVAIPVNVVLSIALCSVLHANN